MSAPAILADAIDSVADVLRPRRPVSIPQFARERLHVVEGPAVGAGGRSVRWRPDTFPLQNAILEAFGDPRWRRVVLMTAPQAFGKTQTLLALIFHALAQRGVSVLYVSTSEGLAVTQWGKKFLPAMEADSELSSLLYENPDHGGTKRERRFTNGSSLHFAGADSVGNLSAFTAPVVVCDDVQGYPKALPGFGPPGRIAETRAAAYGRAGATLAHVGTAGTVEDELWALFDASASYRPFVSCPDCGGYQSLEFARLRFDDSDPVAAAADCRMACANEPCAALWSFDDLPELLESHRWVSSPPDLNWVTNPDPGVIDLSTANVYPETSRRTVDAGFHANALYWPLGQTWGEMAADWVAARGRPDAEKDFQQHRMAIPWREPEIDEERLSEIEVTDRSDGGYSANTVPVGADVVTLTVDVQSGYVYWIARAWAKETGNSWLVGLGTIGKPLKNVEDHERSERRAVGITAALDELDGETRNGWPIVGSGGEVTGNAPLERAAIDVGFEQDVVQGWRSRRGKPWFAIVGRTGRTDSLWPRKPSRDKRRRPFRAVNVNQAKHVLRRALRVPRGEDGYWASPSHGIAKNTLRAYAKHLCSEVWDRGKKQWVKARKNAANHFLDCEAYQVCVAAGLGVRLGGSAPRVRRVVTDWFSRQQGRREAG